MKKRYTSTKNIASIMDKIILDFPQLKGTLKNNSDWGDYYENPLVQANGDGTFIEITVPDSFDIRQIDNIIQNFTPIPKPKRKLNTNQLLQEIANERGLDLI